jgi:hypothetical protein
MNNSVLTSQGTHYVSATKPNRFMLLRGMRDTDCENSSEYIKAERTDRRVVHIVTSLPEELGEEVLL